jgi:hypothetical protein
LQFGLLYGSFAVHRSGFRLLNSFRILFLDDRQVLFFGPQNRGERN